MQLVVCPHAWYWQHNLNEAHKLLIDWCRSSQERNHTAVLNYLNKSRQIWVESCDDKTIKLKFIYLLVNYITGSTVTPYTPDTTSYMHTWRQKHTCMLPGFISTFVFEVLTVVRLLIYWLNDTSVFDSASKQQNDQCFEVINVHVWPNWLSVKKNPSQSMCALALLPFLTSLWIRNYCLVAVDNYSHSPFNTSRPGPQSTACVKWVQLEMCGNMCTPRCLFVVTGWTTSGWKWPVIWARSLGIYEALKCLVSGEGGLAAVAQAGRQAGDRRGEPTTETVAIQ